MAKQTHGNIKKKRIDDATFIGRLIELNENKSALARELKISPSAVVQRLKKIDPDGKLLDSAKASGVAAGIVHKAFENAAPVGSNVKDNAVVRAGFEQGVNVAANSFRVFERLNDYCDTVDEISAQLKKEMSEHMATANAKLKPYHVDLACKLIDKGAKLAEIIHKTRKDVFDMQGTMAFFEAVVRIMAKQIPDVQQQMYLELSQLGAHNEADFLAGPAE